MTKKQETVFKVVHETPDNGVFSSAVIRLGCFCLEYRKNRRTFPPKGTKLLAFSTERDARDFMRVETPHRFQLWEAKASNPKPLKFVSSGYLLYGLHRRDAEFKRFWWRLSILQSEEGDPYYTDPYAPKGTVACDSITLKRRRQ